MKFNLAGYYYLETIVLANYLVKPNLQVPVSAELKTVPPCTIKTSRKPLPCDVAAWCREWKLH